MHYLERQKLSPNTFLILIKSLRCWRQTSGTQTQLLPGLTFPSLENWDWIHFLKVTVYI